MADPTHEIVSDAYEGAVDLDTRVLFQGTLAECQNQLSTVQNPYSDYSKSGEQKYVQEIAS